jgi:CRP/FNR family transcriptional regulator, cyclic AMP receptor protein
MDIRQFLRVLPAFEQFKAADIDALAEKMMVSSHPAGHEFITQGEQGEALYLLVSGTIHSVHVDEATGTAQEARDLHAGEIFGLLSLVEDMPAGWGAVAKEVVTVAELSWPDFRDLFRVAPPIAHHLQYMVAVQLARDLQSRNKELRELMRQRPVSAPV